MQELAQSLKFTGDATQRLLVALRLQYNRILPRPESRLADPMVNKSQ